MLFINIVLLDYQLSKKLGPNQIFLILQDNFP